MVEGLVEMLIADFMKHVHQPNSESLKLTRMLVLNVLVYKQVLSYCQFPRSTLHSGA
jgi:hypothetical protein